MRKVNWTLFILLVCIIACKQKVINSGINSSGQQSTSQAKVEIKQWLEEKIDSTISANNIPALSVGIVRDGKLYYSEGFGFHERGSGKKVNENSIFQIGSDTKKFTAIIVRNLVLKGKLELEESIVSYLPDTLTAAAKEKLRDITVKDLLLHKSGIPNRAPSNKRIDGDPMLIEYTEQDLIHDLNHLELDFEPGTDFGYSNFGYAVVGFISELASGLDYSTLVETYITEKLGMDNTFVYPNDEQLPLIITPYRKDDRTIRSEPWRMGKMVPAGGIYSNVIDLSKLMVAQIKAYREFNENGERDNPLILTESDGLKGSHYGFGLGKTVDKISGSHYGHGGDLDGYASGYVFSPEHNVGLILLTSSGGSWFGQLEKEIRVEVFKDKEK